MPDPTRTFLNAKNQRRYNVRNILGAAGHRHCTLQNQLAALTNYTVIREAFAMSVDAGSEVEYAQRHRPVRAELEQTLREHGTHDYSIFLSIFPHPTTRQLFSDGKVQNGARWKAIVDTEVCWRWWGSMGDIMPSNPDHSPVSVSLQEVFHQE